MLSPAYWDCPSIATNLREAAGGFPSHTDWANGGRVLIQQLPAELNGYPLQRTAYKILLDARFGSNLHETLRRRLIDLFNPYLLDFQNSISLVDCCACLKELRASDSIKVLKCWCNGWATSCRFHEDKILPCLFGCSGKHDDLRHYLVCPHLFSLWSFLTNSGLSPEHVPGSSPDPCSPTGTFTNADVSEMPLIRWGLIDPCTRNLNAISCVFSGYHAVRRHFKTTNQFFEFNQTELSSAQLCCARGVFADAFKVEARELCIFTRKFLPNSFLEFISASDASQRTRRSTRLRSDALL